MSGRPVLVGTVVAELEDTLAREGIPEAGREAREIVAAILDVSRGWPGTYADRPAPPGLVAGARVAGARRSQGMPLQYAVGRAAFRLLTLDVDPRVLIPRPETEGLVDLVLARGFAGGTAVDVGTGSGAIALALAQESGFARVIGTDVSVDALAVAAGNAARLQPALKVPVEWRAGSYLAPVQGVRVRAVVANPPYISFAEAAQLSRGVRDWEPPIALFAGRDGMAPTAAVIDGAAEVLEPGGLLALEVDVRRAGCAAALTARDRRYGEVRVEVDVFGRERFVTAVRRSGE